MSDPFQKVQRGDPLHIAAETFNTLLDVAREFRSRRQSSGREPLTDRTSIGRTKVRNETGGDREMFEVLHLAGPLIGPADHAAEYLHHTSFAGDTVTQAGEARVAILQEPCPAGAIRPAVHAGVSIARLTGPTGTRRGTTVPGEYALAAADAGPFVILHDPGPEEEERFAVVRFDSGGSDDEGGEGSHPCGCHFIPVGAVSCLTEAGNDAANRYEITGEGLQTWLQALGIVDAATGQAPERLIVEYDGDCTWLNLTQVLERDCEEPET